MSDTPRTDALLRESKKRMEKAKGSRAVMDEVARFAKELVKLCKDLEEGNGLLRMFIHHVVDQKKSPAPESKRRAGIGRAG